MLFWNWNHIANPVLKKRTKNFGPWRPIIFIAVIQKTSIYLLFQTHGTIYYWDSFKCILWQSKKKFQINFAAFHFGQIRYEKWIFITQNIHIKQKKFFFGNEIKKSVQLCWCEKLIAYNNKKWSFYDFIYFIVLFSNFLPEFKLDIGKDMFLNINTFEILVQLL